MLAGKAFHRILKNTRGKLHNFKYCIFAFNYIQAQTTIFVNLFLIKLWYLSSSIQASMWTCREPRRFRSQSESMRAFFTDCRYRSTIELKAADNGRPDATGENQSLIMKTPKKDLVHQLRYRLRCFHRLNTTQQSNLLLLPQFQQYRLSLRKGFRRISNCQHSTKSTYWYGSTQLPLYIAYILEPQTKKESKVGDFKPTNSSMDRYLQK